MCILSKGGPLKFRPGAKIHTPLLARGHISFKRAYMIKITSASSVLGSLCLTYCSTFFSLLLLIRPEVHSCWRRELDSFKRHGYLLSVCSNNLWLGLYRRHKNWKFLTFKNDTILTWAMQNLLFSLRRQGYSSFMLQMCVRFPFLTKETS